MSNNGGPAFPTPEVALEAYNDDHDKYIKSYPVDHAGMTLRDYFAAKALNGMLSCEKLASDAAQAGLKPAQYASGLATASYLFADAMLTARAKESTHAD